MERKDLSQYVRSHPQLSDLMMVPVPQVPPSHCPSVDDHPVQSVAQAAMHTMGTLREREREEDIMTTKFAKESGRHCPILKKIDREHYVRGRERVCIV